jgi:hypothetical protein
MWAPGLLYEKKGPTVLFDGLDQNTVYFQINFQTFDFIFGLADITERAGDHTVAIASC